MAKGAVTQQSSAAAGATDRDNCFYVFLTGQVEAAQLHGLDNLYCRYSFSFGPDWRAVQGIDTGLTQTAQKSNCSTLCGASAPRALRASRAQSTRHLTPPRLCPMPCLRSVPCTTHRRQQGGLELSD